MSNAGWIAFLDRESDYLTSGYGILQEEHILTSFSHPKCYACVLTLNPKHSVFESSEVRRRASGTSLIMSSCSFWRNGRVQVLGNKVYLRVYVLNSGPEYLYKHPMWAFRV